MNTFNSILEEIIDNNKIFGEKSKNSDKLFKSAKDFCDKIGVNESAISRMRTGKLPLSEHVIQQIFDYFVKINKDYANDLRKRLEIVKLESLNPSHQTEDSLEEFHHKFFETKPDENRLICFSYRDLPQSRKRGKNPEYIKRSAAVIQQGGLVCALFQPFGPVDKLKEFLIGSTAINDVEAIQAWTYLLTLALGVHEVYDAINLELIKNGGNDGKLVLYEAKEYPKLIACDVHSRLMYSEKLSPLTEEEKREGKSSIRIAQLIMGKDENNVDKEFFIECGNYPDFQSVVAQQFYPVLHFWREYHRLPTKTGKKKGEGEMEDFVRTLPGPYTHIPWNICIK